MRGKMKKRYGFVSNSSSSSFLVVKGGRYNYLLYAKDNILVVDKDFGTCQFGWGPETIYDAPSKIIFAYLQILYIKEYDPGAEFKKIADDCLDMLENVIINNTNVKAIVWDIVINDYNNFSYIDHASSAAEGQNTEIFDSEDTLKDFIFGSNSYIRLDNDNH
jgi:hypothetical protein